MVPLYDYLSLPVIALVSMLLIYVVGQNPHAGANRLFGWYMGISLLILMGGLVALTSSDPALVLVYGHLLTPMMALTSLILIWLVLALFLPKRYAQPAVRWLIGAPYLIATLILIQAPLTGWLIVFVGTEVNADGRLALVSPPGFHPLLGLYLVGNFVLLGLTAAIVIRHPPQRLTAALLLAGLLVNQVISSSPLASRYTVIFSLAPVPIYLAFAWITLRYQVFRPTAGLLQRALDRLPNGVLMLNSADEVQYANAVARQWLNLGQDGDPRSLTTLLDHAGLVVAPAPEGARRFVRQGDDPLILESSETTVRDRQSAARLLVMRDITQRELQAMDLAAQYAEQQRLLNLVATLEAPAIRLTDHTLLAPLVGDLTSKRAQALTQQLLETAHRQRIQTVILDVAGVARMDSEVARAVVKTAQSLGLLGCSVVLSGISAEVAATLAQLDVDLRAMQIVRSPQDVLTRSA